jgi:hypothetical protein
MDDIDRGKLKNSERKMSQCTFFTTNPTWADLGVKPGLGGEWPVTNRLSHGAA